MKTLFYILTITILSLAIYSCQSEKSSPQKNISYPAFYHGCNHVKVLLDQGELEAAMAYFDSISTQVPHVPSKYYYTLAQKSAESDKCEFAEKYLRLAIENGKEYGAIKSTFQKIRSCEKELKGIIAQETEIHDKTFNYKYKAQIDSMFTLDKAFRKAGDETNLVKHDSLNKKLLVELYEKYGYPSEKIVGSITAGSARILMLRTDPNNGNKLFLPLFKEAYDKGFINAREYAGFTDRRRARGINYTAPYYYEMPTSDYSLMIEVEKAEIDKRRDSIGLSRKPGRE